MLTDGLGNAIGDFAGGVLHKEIAGDDGAGGGMIDGAFALKFLRACNIVEECSQMYDAAVGFGYLVTQSEGVFYDAAGVIEVMAVRKAAAESIFYEIL